MNGVWRCMFLNKWCGTRCLFQQGVPAVSAVSAWGLPGWVCLGNVTNVAINDTIPSPIIRMMFGDGMVLPYTTPNDDNHDTRH